MSARLDRQGEHWVCNIGVADSILARGVISVIIELGHESYGHLSITVRYHGVSIQSLAEKLVVTRKLSRKPVK